MSSLAVTGTAKNEAGLETQFTGIINVLDPPVVGAITQSPDPVKRGETVTITVPATDPQGLALTYTLKVGGVDATPVEGQPGKFTYVIPAA